jgi:hypothetical protein
LIFITPNNIPFKTTGNCFEIIDKKVNQGDLNQNNTISLNYKFKKGAKYDMVLVDTSKYNSYEHTACLHSITFNKSKTITIVDDSIPKPFNFHCQERIMYPEETSVRLNFTNTSKYRILELSFAINDPDKFSTHRYLVPWAPLTPNKSTRLFLTYLKSETAEKDLKLKLKLELNGIFKERIILLKFKGEEVEYIFSE